MNKKAIEITHHEYKCPPAPGCPSVFHVGNEYYIIGKKINKQDIPQNVKDKIADDETVIAISKDLIDKTVKES